MGSRRVRVLVVEDNRQLAALLEQGLSESSYDVDVAHDGLAGLRHARERNYDAVLLDWMLPELDGPTVLRTLRNEGDDTPVLMLTARDRLEDRIAGLDTGADDYLVKPFAFDELFARLRALVRRSRGTPATVIHVGDLEVDTTSKTARRAGRSLDLSAREYAILECLAINRNRVVSRDKLYDHVYDHAVDRSSNVIDVYVGHLRKKIDRDHDVKLIHTRRGLGYVLEAPGD